MNYALNIKENIFYVQLIIARDLRKVIRIRNKNTKQIRLGIFTETLKASGM